MDIRKWVYRIKTVIWLSYTEQSNWTKIPFYIIYIFINPVFEVAIFSYVYIAVAYVGNLLDPLNAFYMITGVGLFNFIGSGLYGVIWTIHSEREHFRTLKYTYLAFPNLHLYLTFRGLYHYIIGLITSTTMIIIGLTLTNNLYMLDKIEAVPIIILLISGVIWSSQLGVLVAASSIYSSEYGPLISEAFGGILFLLGAVLYPIEALPPLIQPLAYIFPTIEWLDLMRYYLSSRYSVGDVNILWINLLIKMIGYIIVVYIYFRIVEYMVRRRGMLEASLHH